MPQISRRVFLACVSAAGAAGAGNASLTGEVADFITGTSFQDLPGDVLELGKKSVLDSLGLALCGSVSETLSIAREYVHSLGVAGGTATVIGTKTKLPPRFAAMLNALAIHADDYDDTQLAVAPDRTYGLLTHPSCTSTAAALAACEAAGLSGRDFLLAYHLGVEVQCKIAEAMAPRHYDQGFHSTGTMGTIGAAVAVAKARGLNREQTLRAISIAASSASGLRENFGTMTKPLHAGRAAENGVAAADLAKLGWTAADQILEARRGFFQAAGGGYDPKAISGKLGNPWTFTSPGISIKPHPSGSLTHPGMTEMTRLIRQHDIQPADVVHVAVGVNRNLPNALIHHRPKTHLEAKFSMEFCMASLLLYRRAGLREFTDEVVNRAEVQRMIERVEMAVHPEAEQAGYHKMATLLEVKLKDGRVLRGRADFGKGSPQIPMSYAEEAEKFLDCAAFAKWPVAKSKAVVEAVRTLESMKNVRELAALCAS